MPKAKPLTTQEKLNKLDAIMADKHYKDLPETATDKWFVRWYRKQVLDGRL